jgi:hypothetical protein
MCSDVHFLGSGYGELLRKMVRRIKAVLRNDKKRDDSGQSGTIITSLRYLYRLYSSLGNFGVNTMIISNPFLAYC